MKTILPLILLVAGEIAANAGIIKNSPKTDADFEARKETLTDRTPFKIFEDSTLTGDRLEAMKFLYAYMPLPDLAGYSPEFILENVDASLRAIDEMPWGKDIPEREFLHFVLPLRVNNENFDSSRVVFYEELKERVKNMTIDEAILETNHWCHEKVTYQPSDGRTSSPLSSVSQAIGRCGEESTFTVAALRSIGIPARQVYTPRWAHTDDNHAWVEAYANGKWHFLGACEPEPILDLGWFNAPASRGMLMNTNVFGQYDGPEEKLSQNDVITTINVTENYAPIDTIHVVVTDVNGRPVEGAKVNFCIYNYAEFYPAASKITDSNGKAQLTTGLGDVLVWVTDGTKFGFAQGSSKSGETLNVVMDKDNNYKGTFELTIVPPQQSGTLPQPTDQQRAVNNARFAKEDSIRNAYTSTFFKHGSEEGMSPALDKILTESRGNHKALRAYLATQTPDRKEKAIQLLQAVTEKDRRDIPMEVIEDHITYSPVYADSALWVDYVLNPRIDREALTPFKSFFREVIEEATLAEYKENPQQLVEWIENNVEIGSKWNPQQLRQDPRVSWTQRAADKRSADILFVAMARSAGIPARIDPVTSNTQYVDANGDWIDVNFGVPIEENTPKGKIRLDYDQVGRIENPAYYTQFSISRFTDGVPVQLEFDEGAGVNEINALDKELDAGKYMLVTGQRLANGSVLVKGDIFDVTADSTTTVPVVIRQDDSQVQVVGSLNAENTYHDMSLDEDKSILSTTGRGYYILGIVKASDEPSAHALNDISAMKDDLEKWGREIIVLFPSQEESDRFNFDAYQNLPSNLRFGIDNGNVSMNEIVESVNLPDNSAPVFVIADTFNRVVFVSQGYTIGLGHQLLDTIEKL